MTAREVKKILFALLEGRDNVVDAAPIMNPEEILEGLRKIAEKRPEQMCYADRRVIYSLVKGLKSGEILVEDVN